MVQGVAWFRNPGSGHWIQPLGIALEVQAIALEVQGIALEVQGVKIDPLLINS